MNQPQYPPINLSSELTQALAMEEYHRDQLIWWKSRREFLETQLPINNPFYDFIQEIPDNDNTETIKG
jgi:hypothetical protein